jgi:hypothetical protein
MQYTFEVTIPGGTQEDTPVRTDYIVAEGKITLIAPVLPNGCNDLVLWRLLMDNTQIVPTTAGAWMKGNGAIGPFPEDIEIPGAKTMLSLIACAPNAMYPHAITVYVSIVQAGATIEDVVNALKVSMPETSQIA